MYLNEQYQSIIFLPPSDPENNTVSFKLEFGGRKVNDIMNSWISYDPFSLIMSQTPVSTQSSSTFVNSITKDDYNASVVTKTIDFD